MGVGRVKQRGQHMSMSSSGKELALFGTERRLDSGFWG